jgi:TolA-binding protein
MTLVARWMQRRLLQCLGAPIGTILSSDPEPITDVRRQQERNQAKIAELQQELRRVEVERDNNHAKVKQLEVEREKNQSKVMKLQQQLEARAKSTERTRRHSHRHHNVNHHHHHHNHRGHNAEEERILSAEVAQLMSKSEVVPSQPLVNQRIGAKSGLCVIS